MPPALDVLLLGATGTIGRATAAALLRAGHRVTALVRPGSVPPAGCAVREGEVTRPGTVAGALAGGGFSAVVSCLASRTGEPRDARAIDHAATVQAIAAARAAGVRRFVLLSALCVQQPELPFQRAKLKAEAALRASGLVWTIVRPTAFFKSLSGQVARVKAGQPFVAFGDGRLTACKPISDRDLGDFLASCLTDPAAENRILPIGGPGPALTPADQAALLGELLGREVPLSTVPVALITGAAILMSLGGLVSPRLRRRASLARIGRYYATHSMLVWDAAAGRYDADATPETGRDTLRDHYSALLRGEAADDRGAHAVF
jgi:divinyl chlorophyllide a 8-vinyl-reductase